MTDHADLRHLPEAIAVPHQRMRVSAVWVIPILAALVALGIAIQRVWSEGPTITILFDAAPGVERRVESQLAGFGFDGVCGQHGSRRT